MTPVSRCVGIFQETESAFWHSGNLPVLVILTSLDTVSCAVGVFLQKPQKKTPPRQAARVSTTAVRIQSFSLMSDFTPSHHPTTFDGGLPAVSPTAVIPVLSSTRLPAFTGRNFFTTTGSSATSHAIAFLSHVLNSNVLA